MPKMPLTAAESTLGSIIAAKPKPKANRLPVARTLKNLGVITGFPPFSKSLSVLPRPRSWWVNRTYVTAIHGGTQGPPIYDGKHRACRADTYMATGGQGYTFFAVALRPSSPTNPSREPP